MAFGMLCIRCGYQESEHSGITRANKACGAYKSPDAKAEAAMWKEDKENQDHRESFKYRGPAYDH